MCEIKIKNNKSGCGEKTSYAETFGAKMNGLMQKFQQFTKLTIKPFQCTKQ